MTKQSVQLPEDCPIWYDGKTISEPLFCHEFLSSHLLVHTERAFFTPEGKVADENTLRSQIYDLLEPFINTSVTKKIDNIMGLLRIKAHVDELPPQTDRIHLANGTLFLDGRFSEEKNEIVRCRFPIRYNAEAEGPKAWLNFLDQLLYPEDIPTLQEFIGYCLIPSTAAQKMLVIKGSGGEGKSQIGAVLSHLFGTNAKDGSIGKVSENRFARADLEHILLMIDDDMRMEALKQTNYIKSLVTAQGKMDLERKGRQSYQGYFYARFIAFSNGDLQALYDRSVGFFRRQLVLTTKDRDPNRADDPHLAWKLCQELEGIFLWAFEGLQRLMKNHFRFTESKRAVENRRIVREDSDNMLAFMESEGYILLNPETSISSEEISAIYQIWCKENSMPPVKPRKVSEFLIAHQKEYGLEHTNNHINSAGRRVRGFRGIEALIHPTGEDLRGFTHVWPKDNPFEDKLAG